MSERARARLRLRAPPCDVLPTGRATGTVDGTLRTRRSVLRMLVLSMIRTFKRADEYRRSEILSESSIVNSSCVRRVTRTLLV